LSAATAARLSLGNNLCLLIVHLFHADDGRWKLSPAASRPTPSEEDYGSWTWKQKFEDLIACDPSRNIMPKHPESASYFKEKLEVHGSINLFLQFPERRLNIGY